MSHQGLSRDNLKSMIRLYYRSKPLIEPYYLSKREIAIYSLEDGVYIRHLSFTSMTLLYRYILEEKTPLHLYYSSAYYEDPSADKMELKGWMGSDLIFDIDSDHYPGCSDVLSICLGSGEVYGEKIKKCSDGSKPVIYPLISFNCIRRGWIDAIRLITILREEFGLKNIHLAYSGNRGFHISVYDEEVMKLEREQRREIADYISFKNPDLSRIAPSIGRRKYVYFSREEYGWRKRIVDEIVKRENYEEYRGYIRVKYSIVEEIAEDIGVNIDPVVTMDISRLSRFNRSIHGKSGLIVYPLNYSSTDIDEYSYESFTPFEGEVVVKPYITIAGLKVLDEEIDLNKGLKIKTKPHIGLYLALKGLVEIVDIRDIGVRNV